MLRLARSVNSTGTFRKVPRNGQHHDTRRLTSATRRLILAAIVLVAAACDGNGPAAPTGTDLTGIWFGDLGTRAPADWSEATIELEQEGQSLTGTLTADGGSWPLTGAFQDGTFELTVGGLPGTSTCSGLFLQGQPQPLPFGVVVVLTGRMTGRCFGTVVFDFTLTRIG